MQSVSEQTNEIKTQLFTPEGVYRLVPHAEYSRPKTSGYASSNTSTLGAGAAGAGGASNSTPVRISFTKYFADYHLLNRLSHSLTDDLDHSSVQSPPHSNNIETNVINHSNNVPNTPTNSTFFVSNRDPPPPPNNDTTIVNGASDSFTERVCFNIGKEIFIFVFNGLQPADLTKLVDRRTYKTSIPTCHDFCSPEDKRISQLLIGFSGGQVQLIDLYRPEKLIDKTKTTCVRWLPRSKSSFLVSYSSGQLYLYKEDLTCGNTAPNYQQFKSGEGYTIYTCKTKSSRNPIFRWSIGDGAINEFAFSPCGQYLATVSQDGFLRVFLYDRMELFGRMRSYFGGLLCLSWSADSKLIVTGGEDDLITVWSVVEKRVIARGQGHKSWVNAVTFDPYMSGGGGGHSEDCVGGGGSESENDNRSVHTSRSNDFPTANIYYRIGSVGQDTQICLWDLTEELIEQSLSTNKSSRSSLANIIPAVNPEPSKQSTPNGIVPSGNNSSSHHHHHHPFFNSLIKVSKLDHKRSTFSLSSRSFLDKSATNHHYQQKGNNTAAKNCKNSIGDVNLICANSTTTGSDATSDPVKLLGTSLCPKLFEVPMLEPIVCKKISFERLTALVFRREYFVVANQDGKISIFARPTKSNNPKLSSPNPSLASGLNEIVCDDTGTAII